MALAAPDSATEEAPEIPRQRHKREVVGGVRVNLTRSEARMLAELQSEWDLPFAQLFRVMLREEHRRTFGRPPVAYPELGETG
jgi:hypothetical protein